MHDGGRGGGRKYNHPRHQTHVSPSVAKVVGSGVASSGANVTGGRVAPGANVGAEVGGTGADVGTGGGVGAGVGGTGADVGYGAAVVGAAVGASVHASTEMLKML